MENTYKVDHKLDEKIIRGFVARHIRGDVSDIMDAVLGSGEEDLLPFSTDMLDSAIYVECPLCGEIIARGKNAVETMMSEADDDDDDDILYGLQAKYLGYPSGGHLCCDACGSYLSPDELVEHVDMPKQWILVTDSLGAALEYRGEIVLDKRYWGRYCSDENDIDYANDEIIVGICRDIGILSGQEHCPIKQS